MKNFVAKMVATILVGYTVPTCMVRTWLCGIVKAIAFSKE